MQVVIYLLIYLFFVYESTVKVSLSLNLTPFDPVECVEREKAPFTSLQVRKVK